MITFTNLTKRYGTVTAANNVSFTIEPGSVTGFLGPNGAGKFTSMRCLVGLAQPTSGTATILGKTYAQLNNPAARVGVLLDASAQHPGRTGREALTLTGLTLMPVLALGWAKVQAMLGWIDLNTASVPVMGAADPGGTQWVKFGVAALVWVVVPTVIGWVRHQRREVK